MPAHTRSRNSSSLLYNIDLEGGMRSDLVEYCSTSVHLGKVNFIGHWIIIAGDKASISCVPGA